MRRRVESITSCYVVIHSFLALQNCLLATLVIFGKDEKRWAFTDDYKKSDRVAKMFRLNWATLYSEGFAVFHLICSIATDFRDGEPCHEKIRFRVSPGPSQIWVYRLNGN